MTRSVPATGRGGLGSVQRGDLNNAWQFSMGYRFAIFNYATQALGGGVTVRRFDMTTR